MNQVLRGTSLGSSWPWLLTRQTGQTTPFKGWSGVRETCAPALPGAHTCCERQDAGRAWRAPGPAGDGDAPAEGGEAWWPSQQCRGRAPPGLALLGLGAPGAGLPGAGTPQGWAPQGCAVRCRRLGKAHVAEVTKGPGLPSRAAPPPLLQRTPGEHGESMAHAQFPCGTEGTGCGGRRDMLVQHPGPSPAPSEYNVNKPHLSFLGDLLPRALSLLAEALAHSRLC